MENVATDKKIAYTEGMPIPQDIPISEADLKAITGLSQIDFAGFCKSVREEEDLSLVQMARKLSLSHTAYVNLEKGTSKPSATTLIALMVIRAKKRNINLKALFL